MPECAMPLCQKNTFLQPFCREKNRISSATVSVQSAIGILVLQERSCVGNTNFAPVLPSQQTDLALDWRKAESLLERTDFRLHLGTCMTKKSSI
uniref:Uncharacterized protein n=1 Tax=Arundo donax TaxID=35708 RepID=A0A0A9BQ89_ARUDO